MLADCCQMRKGETERGLLTSSLFPLPSSDGHPLHPLHPLQNPLPNFLLLKFLARTQVSFNFRSRSPYRAQFLATKELQPIAGVARTRLTGVAVTVKAPPLSQDSRTQSQRQKNRPQPLESDCLSLERTILSEIHPKHRQLHLQADSPPQAIGRLPPMAHLTHHKLPQLWLLSLPAPAPPPQDLPTRLASLTRRIFAPRFSE